MVALVVALIAAAVGSGITWLLGAPDRAQSKKASESQDKLLEIQRELLRAQQATAEAQSRIAALESQRDEREFFEQFAPRVQFSFQYPEGNSLTLEASEPFIVEMIDYLTGSGASVGSEAIQKSGKSMQLPLNVQHLGQVCRVGPWLNPTDRSADIQFRLHLLKDGLRKEHIVRAIVKPEFIQTPRSQTQVLKVIG